MVQRHSAAYSNTAAMHVSKTFSRTSRFHGFFATADGPNLMAVTRPPTVDGEMPLER